MSLRWKILLLPLIGFSLIAVVLFVFINLSNRIHQDNVDTVDEKLTTVKSFIQISNALATNHVRIYDLLRDATKYEDEGKFYDDGKPYLLEIHRLEALLKSEVKTGVLDKKELELLERIQSQIVDYRNNTVNAILMATVEQDLANRVLTDSTTKYNELSADILAFSDSNQALIKQQFQKFDADLSQQIGYFSIGIILTIAAVLVLSFLLSRVLSRDLSENIKTLGRLVSADADNQKPDISFSGNEMSTLRLAIDDVQRTYHHLKLTRDELTEKELRLRSIIDNISDAIITIDHRGKIESFNLAAERIFGYTQTETLGKNVSMLMPEPYHSEHDVYIRQYLKTGVKHVIGMRREVQGKRKDGTLFDIEFTVTELQLGEQKMFTALLKDITDIKASNLELDTYRAHLEELVSERTHALEIANRELEAFSYSVSHDLRSPLRSIDGFSYALQEDYADKLDSVGLDYLDRVRSCAQDMAQLIDDMLELSRMSRIELKIDLVDMSALAQSILGHFREQDQQRQVEVKIDTDLRARGDQRLIRILLDNLLGNAWKYTATKEYAIIEFGRIQQQGEDVYFIKDNGVGFDMQYVHKIFSAFQRLHSVDQFKGTGVGLATVQRVINRHGGKIWAEGQVDEGATFFFKLPPQIKIEEQSSMAV